MFNNINVYSCNIIVHNYTYIIMHNEYVYICMVTRYGEFERPLPACQLASSARSSPGESDRCPKVRDRGPKVSRNRLPKMGVPEKTRDFTGKLRDQVDCETQMVHHISTFCFCLIHCMMRSPF